MWSEKKGGICDEKIILVGILSLVLMVLNMRVIADAETLPEDKGSSMEFVEISEDEMIPETVGEMTANVMARAYESRIYTYGVSFYSEDGASNIDPSNAYVVANDTVMQGVIETTNEMRWYAFSISEKSKISILLQMVETVDADIYMFQLNEETYDIELIGGSANEGLGISEYFNNVMDAGIYFFAISGYEGTGQFAFAYYQSTADVANEVNDTKETATSAAMGCGLFHVI